MSGLQDKMDIYTDTKSEEKSLLGEGNSTKSFLKGNEKAISELGQLNSRKK